MTWWLLLIHHFRDGKSENEMFCNLRKVTQFINARKWKVKVIFAQLCPTLCNPWTIACLTPLSMEFSRQEYWSGLPCSSPRDLHLPGIKPGSPALQADSLPSQPPGKPINARSRTQIPGSLAPGVVLKHSAVKNPPAMRETLVWFLSWKDPLETLLQYYPLETGYPLQYSWAFLVAQKVKNSPTMRETWVQSGVGKIPWRRAWQFSCTVLQLNAFPVIPSTRNMNIFFDVSRTF